MTKYDGVLRRPFLYEHWHKGFVSALAIWLPVFLATIAILPGAVNAAIVLASAVSAVVLLAVLTHYEGFSIDVPAGRYRSYTWVAGLRFGSWQPLPNITRIKVRAVRKKHLLPVETSPVSVGLIATEHAWQVLLNVEHTQVGIVAANANKGKALRIAGELAALFNTEITIV